MNRIPFRHLTKGHGGDSEHYCSTAGEIYKPLQHILYKTLNIKLTSGITFYTKLHFYISIYFQAELDSITACRKILFVKGPTVERIVAMSLNAA
jgi:hypothetical protein